MEKYSTESDEESSSIAVIESEGYEDFDISSNIEESEECESDLSYHTSTINVTDVISDNSFEIVNDSSIAEIGSDGIDDVHIEILEPDLVEDELTEKDTSSPLPIDEAEKKLRNDYSCCSVNELDNNSKSFVSTCDTGYSSNTYAEPINEKSILEKLDCMKNVSHEFNNRVKITKVESFNNDCKNESKIVYKIKKLESKKQDLRMSNDRTTIDDLTLNIQALNQQTSNYLFQLKETISKYEINNRGLEERLRVLENLMLKKYNLNQQVEADIEDTLMSTTQNNENAIEKNLREVDDETIVYDEHHELTNMASWTENAESTVEGNLTMFDDDKLIYQHEESSNVIIGWHEDEENPIENNLLLVENGDSFHDYEEETITGPTDVSYPQNVENICGKNLLRTEDNFYERKELFNAAIDWGYEHEENVVEDKLMMMEDNESIYQFEEWLDSSFSDLENEENPENNSLPAKGDQIDSISEPNESTSPSNSLEDNTEETILTEKRVLKRKELSVVLDRDAVPNYLKKRKIKSFDSAFTSCSDSEEIISLIKKKEPTQLFKIKKYKDDKNENINQEVEFPEYNCAICKSKFVNLELLHEHAGSHMKAECNCKQFTINCNKPNLLGRHVNKKRPFKYNPSNHSKTSNRHIRSNSDQQPFKCKFCSFTCAYASNLEVHKLRHVLEKSNE